MPRKKRRRRPQLTREQKLERQKEVIAALREKYGSKVVTFGFCADCLLPLTHPGVKVPLFTTFEWSEDSPDLLAKYPEYCVLEGCAHRALERYRSAVQEGLAIRGTYHGPDPVAQQPAESEKPLDTPEGS